MKVLVAALGGALIVGCMARPAVAQAFEFPPQLEGTVSFTEAYDVAPPYGNTPACIHFEASGTLQLQLQYAAEWDDGTYDAAAGTWTASSSCTGENTWVEDGETCSWSYSSLASGTGAFPESMFSLAVNAGEEPMYAGASFFLMGGAVTTRRVYSCGNVQYDDTTTDIPGWNATIDGHAEGGGDSLRVLLEGSATYGHIPTTYTWSGTLRAQGIELVVMPVGFDGWLPQAGADELTRGNTLEIRARLEQDGGPPPVEAERFTFELADVSREPGTSMNFPLPALALDSLDLRFDDDLNASHTIERGGRRLIVDDEGIEASAVLSSYDWGAYGTLRVTAHLTDGGEVVGYLYDDRGQTDIRLPKRGPDSRIARSWKTEHGMVDRFDDDDTDGTPDGDGHAGDGLSLYQEYRGFMENQRHLRTDPRHKDLFVFDEVQGRTKHGIALFQAASGLRVHHQLLNTEFDPLSRVVNANRGYAHLDDQHGLWIKPGKREFLSLAMGGPGLPRQIQWIELATNVRTSPDYWVQYASGEQTVAAEFRRLVVAHELGHAVNVWHHGQRDLSGVSWVMERDNAGGFVWDDEMHPVVTEYINGQRWGPVEIRKEDGTRFTPLWLLSSGRRDNLWMGLPQGEHSGDDSCVMRYGNGFVYPQSISGDVRYVIRFTDTPGLDYGEVPGYQFCTSEVGTGVNAEGRSPQPRYGYADQHAPPPGPTKRGDCLHRVCVNDRLSTH